MEGFEKGGGGYKESWVELLSRSTLLESVVGIASSAQGGGGRKDFGKKEASGTKTSTSRDKGDVQSRERPDTHSGELLRRGGETHAYWEGRGSRGLDGQD